MEKVIVPVRDLVDWFCEKASRCREGECQIVRDGRCDARQIGDVRCRYLVLKHFITVYPRHEGGE